MKIVGCIYSVLFAAAGAAAVSVEEFLSQSGVAPSAGLGRPGHPAQHAGSTALNALKSAQEERTNMAALNSVNYFTKTQ